MRLAENGFPISKRLADEFERQRLLSSASASAAASFERWQNVSARGYFSPTELAATLSDRQERRREFYSGETLTLCG